MATRVSDKRLYRMRDGAYIGGVCAGIAEYFEVDTIVVRILAVMLAALTMGLAFIGYVVLWSRLPLESDKALLYDVRPESAESSSFGCVDYDFDLSAQNRGSIPMVARVAIAAGLMVLFLVVAMGVSPLVPGTRWWQFWPIGLVMLGLCLIIIPIRTRSEAAWHVVGIALTSIAASIIPMSLGIMSWNTIGSAFGHLWPVAVVGIALFAGGVVRKNDALLFLAAVCIVAFCLMGLTFCVVPGEVESLLLSMPSGDSLRIVFVR